MVSLLTTCSPLNPVNLKTSKVTLNTGINPAVSRAAASDVASFQLTVTADGMATVEKEFTDDSISLEIVAGPARTFTLQAFDADENILFSGSSTINLTAGEPAEIVIELDYAGFYVAFETNGAGELETQYISSGETITTPEGLSLAGFSLAGWYTDEDLTSAWNFGTDTVMEDMTLYVKWTAVIPSYSITYVLDGGINDISNPADYTEETPTITLAAPTRSDYTFNGWFTDPGFTIPITEITLGSTGNVIVYAEWITVSATGVVLETSALHMVPTETLTLETVFSPFNASDRGASWVSSNTSVATVNTSGLITAVADGISTITVTTDDGGYTDDCVITVIQGVAFSYTGDMQTWTVPGGITEINLNVWGAEGGGSRLSSNTASGLGGLGGYSTGTLTVTPGDVINIFVGGYGESSEIGVAAGGWNGGGSGYGSSAGEPGNGGGGASDIRFGGTALTDRVIVAGGGGGGGEDAGDSVGQGGGLEGTGYPGFDATQIAAGTNGSLGLGASTNSADGGGGGGGYYGGGTTASASVGDDSQGGGGGSGYIGGVTGGTTTAAVNEGRGKIIIDY